MKRFAQLTTLCLIVAVSSLSFVACSQNDDASPLAAGETAPNLPSPSTMLVDLSFFGVDGLPSEEQKLAGSEAMVAAGDRSHWIQAFVRATFVVLSFFDALEEPVGAFAVAIHAVPQPQPDGSYLWTYIFVEGPVEYSIFLYGNPLEDRVEWRMEVSSNDPQLPLDHFVWFDGESMIDEESGFWQFYTPQLGEAALATASMTDGAAVLRIDWEDSGPRNSLLTITNNEEGGENEGDVLTFRERPLVNTIDFTDADAEQHHNITWYRDGSGSITVPDYNNAEQACWDTDQRNIDCP